MFARVTTLAYWKSEHRDLSTSEDASKVDIGQGLFAVSDGAGTTPFADLWARVLVDHFIEVPLMNDYPFEVEWWVRLAQKKFTPPKPETLPWHVQQKARGGSQATLATVRILESGYISAQAELLAFGDTCIFVGRRVGENGAVKLTFPLEHVSDFDALPICVPSAPQVFNRSYHKCQKKRVEVRDGDIVILATDAVAKWILSRGHGTYEDSWQSFQKVLGQDDSSWPDFIKGCRERGEMIDDDSTAVVIRLQEEQEGKGWHLLGETQPPHGEEITLERQKRFQEAYDANQTDLIALYYGDGIDLENHVHVSQQRVDYARDVAEALRVVIQMVRTYINDDANFVAKVVPVWEKYKGLLQDESCAKNIRETLKAKGISVSAPQSRPASSVSNSTKGSSQQLISPVSPVSSQPAQVQAPMNETVASAPTKDAVSPAANPDIFDDSGGKTIIQSRPEPRPVPSIVSLLPDDQARPLLIEIERAIKTNHRTKLEEVQRYIKDIMRWASSARNLERFMRAYFEEDDLTVESIFKEWREENNPLVNIIPEESIDEIILRGASLRSFRIALKKKENARLIGGDNYKKILDKSKQITSEEREQLRLAHEWVEALKRDNDEALLKAREDIEQYKGGAFLSFSPEEEERYQRARENKEAPKRFNEALDSKRATLIVEAYGKLPPTQQSRLDDRERAVVRMAEKIFNAYKSRNDDDIIDAREVAATPLYRDHFTFSLQEDDLYNQAQARMIARLKFSVPVAKVNGREISLSLLQKVHPIRELYTLFMLPILELKRLEEPWIPQEIEHLKKQLRAQDLKDTLEDLINDLLIQAEIESLKAEREKLRARGVDVAKMEPDTVLRSILVNFKNFSKQRNLGLHNEFSDEDIQIALRIFILRDLFAEFYLRKLYGEKVSVDNWLELKRQSPEVIIIRHLERVIASGELPERGWEQKSEQEQKREPEEEQKREQGRSWPWARGKGKSPPNVS